MNAPKPTLAAAVIKAHPELGRFYGAADLERRLAVFVKRLEIAGRFRQRESGACCR